MNIIILLLCTLASSCLYRAGGMAQESQEKWSKWIPKCMRHSWVRDWLCPLFVLLPLAFKGYLSWWMIPTYGLIGGSLTTYWDWLFGDVDTFWFAGLMVGIALFPLIFAGLAWWIVLARAVVIGICWGIWCGVFSNADAEEYGRGAFLLLPSFFI